MRTGELQGSTSEDRGQMDQKFLQQLPPSAPLSFPRRRPRGLKETKGAKGACKKTSSPWNTAPEDGATHEHTAVPSTGTLKASPFRTRRIDDTTRWQDFPWCGWSMISILSGASYMARQPPSSDGRRHTRVVLVLVSRPPLYSPL